MSSNIQARGGPPPDPSSAANQLHTIPQVLDQLGISRATFYKIVKKGDLAVVKLEGTSRVRAKDLQRYVDHLPQLHAEATE